MLLTPLKFSDLRTAGSAVTSEVRYLDANKPEDTWQVVLPRVNDVEYDVDHRRDHFFITLRDEKRPNSELFVAPVADPTNTTVRLMHPRPYSPTLCQNVLGRASLAYRLYIPRYPYSDCGTYDSFLCFAQVLLTF